MFRDTNRSSSIRNSHNNHSIKRLSRRRTSAMKRASISGIVNNNSNTVKAAVGTEAIAQMNIQKNGEEFQYPKHGFITPIEHSLLYNMLKEPKIYPRSVLIQHILEEEYDQYIHVCDDSSKRSTQQDTTTILESSSHSDSKNDNSDSNYNNDNVSYAQLSALLALCIEKYPPTDEDLMNIETKNKNDSVPDVLGKHILQFVISYAESKQLDRQYEIQELLRPVERYTMNRNVQGELQAVGLLYAAYTATLVTANPIPGLIGLALWNTKRMQCEQNMHNITTFQNETNRRSNIETCGLLEEMEE